MSFLPGHFPSGAAFAGPYRAQGVFFDGTNDFLNAGATLTGAADSKLWTCSMWLRTSSAIDTLLTFNDTGSALSRSRFVVLSGNTIEITGVVGGLNQLRATTAGTISTTGWTHFLFSVDMANTANRSIYLNDALDSTTWTSYVDTALDFTEGDFYVGQRGDGSGRFTGYMADVQMWLGTYVDFSTTANRRLFIDGSGKPVNPSIAEASLGTPILRLSGPLGTWHTNKGSGGGFTLTGALDSAGFIL